MFGCPVPVTIPEKRDFLLSNGIALWDVIASCEITGSSDSSIRDVTVNDLSPILEAIRVNTDGAVPRVFANGAKSFDLYMKYTYSMTGVKAVKLPSTSPANAAWSLARLTEEWRRLILG